MRAKPSWNTATGTYLLPLESVPLQLLEGLQRGVAMPALSPPPRFRLRPTKYARLRIAHARWTHHGRQPAGGRRARGAPMPAQGSAARACRAVCCEAGCQPRASRLHGRPDLGDPGGGNSSGRPRHHRVRREKWVSCGFFRPCQTFANQSSKVRPCALPRPSAKHSAHYRLRSAPRR